MYGVEACVAPGFAELQFTRLRANFFFETNVGVLECGHTLCLINT